MHELTMIDGVAMKGKDIIIACHTVETASLGMGLGNTIELPPSFTSTVNPQDILSM